MKTLIQNHHWSFKRMAKRKIGS